MCSIQSLRIKEWTVKRTSWFHSQSKLQPWSDLWDGSSWATPYVHQRTNTLFRAHFWSAYQCTRIHIHKTHACAQRTNAPVHVQFTLCTPICAQRIKRCTPIHTHTHIHPSTSTHIPIGHKDSILEIHLEQFDVRMLNMCSCKKVL